MQVTDEEGAKKKKREAGREVEKQKPKWETGKLGNLVNTRAPLHPPTRAPPAVIFSTRSLYFCFFPNFSRYNLISCCCCCCCFCFVFLVSQLIIECLHLWVCLKFCTTSETAPYYTPLLSASASTHPPHPLTMKLSSSALTALALSYAFSPVAAVASLGFNLGVKDNSGNCKTTDEYTSDLHTLSAYTNHVKTYSVSDCNTLANLGPVAEGAGFQITVGVWPTPSDKFELEKQTLQSLLPTLSKSTISSILVGSEALYRGDLTGEELGSYISEIKTLLSSLSDKDGNSYADIPVGTVDSWNKFVDGTANAAIGVSDVIYANAFSYWQGQTLANSSFSFFDDIMQALQTIQTVKGSTDIDFWVGETGWPTEGSNFGSSVPSVDNAATFWQQGVCAMRGWGVNTFVFEAFDESWKPETSGSSVEPHWGVYTDQSQLKYSLDCSF